MKYVKKLKLFLSFSLFLLMAFGVFAKVSYLYRNASDTQDTLLGLNNEEADLYDVIYIGGSDAINYWQPPRAWYEYGISSYVYGTHSLQAEIIKREMIEISKSQSPKLWIVSARSFEYYSPEIRESGIRNVTDALPYSMNRSLMVNDALKYKDIKDIDFISYYFDIAFYHLDETSIKSVEKWKKLSGEKKARYKGGALRNNYEQLNRPTINNKNDIKPIMKESEEILIDLLDYCKKSDYQVLFVVIPFFANDTQLAMHNYIQKIVEDYGYGFVNGNKLYDEMKIDFAKDFCDINHVNSLGAKKYTEYLSKYLVDNYDLNDCRKDPRFDKWGGMCNEFAVEEEQVNKHIFELIETKEYSKKKMSMIRETDDVLEWLELTKDPNYYVLIETHGDSWGETAQTRDILGRFSIAEGMFLNQIRIYNLNDEIATNFSVKEKLEASVTGRFPKISDMEVMYEINCGDKSSICIAGKECAVQGDGMSIVVYDVANKELVDSVLLYQNEDDEILLKR